MVRSNRHVNIKILYHLMKFLSSKYQIFQCKELVDIEIIPLLVAVNKMPYCTAGIT